MKTKWIFFFLCVCVAGNVSAVNKLDSLLNLLDKTIEEHETYTFKRESRISQLKERRTHADACSPELYNLNMELYKEYKVFVCDSAIHYLSENIEIATRMRELDRENESKLLLSYLFASSGMYKESVDIDRKSVV